MHSITVHPVLDRVRRIGGDRVMPSPSNEFCSIVLNGRGNARVVTIDKKERNAHITIALSDKSTCLTKWHLEGKAKPKRDQISGGWVFYLTVKDFKQMPDDFIDFIITSRSKI